MEKLNERDHYHAGNNRHLVSAPGLYIAETGGIHLTERILSGDKQK